MKVSGIHGWMIGNPNDWDSYWEISRKTGVWGQIPKLEDIRNPLATPRAAVNSPEPVRLHGKMQLRVVTTLS